MGAPPYVNDGRSTTPGAERRPVLRRTTSAAKPATSVLHARPVATITMTGRYRSWIELIPGGTRTPINPPNAGIVVSGLPSVNATQSRRNIWLTTSSRDSSASDSRTSIRPF